MKFKIHHKIGAYLAGPGVVHHCYEMAREHIFLAIHEYISHQGWVLYTVGAVAIAVGAPTAFLAWRNKRKTENV